MLLAGPSVPLHYRLCQCLHTLSCRHVVCICVCEWRCIDYPQPNLRPVRAGLITPGHRAGAGKLGEDQAPCSSSHPFPPNPRPSLVPMPTSESFSRPEGNVQPTPPSSDLSRYLLYRLRPQQTHHAEAGEQRNCFCTALPRDREGLTCPHPSSPAPRPRRYLTVLFKPSGYAYTT